MRLLNNHECPMERGKVGGKVYMEGKGERFMREKELIFSRQD